MQVECTFFGPLRESAGTRTVEQELPGDATVDDLVDRLAAEFDEFGEQVVDEDGGLSEAVNVTVDGRNVRQLDGEDSPLEDGATVRFAMSVVGG